MVDDRGSAPLSSDPYGDFLAKVAKVERGAGGSLASSRDLFSQVREKFGASLLEVDVKRFCAEGIKAGQSYEQVDLLFRQQSNHDFASQPVKLKQAFSWLGTFVRRHFPFSSRNSKKAS